nr:MAG TPA: hypothetical protein [Bacteriophage sp.]
MLFYIKSRRFVCHIPDSLQNNAYICRIVPFMYI